MIAIIDYGSGNVRSAQKAFERLGYEAVLTDDATMIASAEGVVLPGVGAFGDCYAGIESRGLVGVIKDVIAGGRPFLGICVGLQLLFESSEESPGVEGLGIVKGIVRRFVPTPERKVPHMGWNQLLFRRADCPLLHSIEPDSFCYFVHSYYGVPEDDSIIAADCEYGVKFAAMLWRDNLFATQFHPEKSQKVGLQILRNFGELAHR